MNMIVLSSTCLIAAFPLTSHANAVGPNTDMQRPQLSPAEWQVKNTTTAALNLLLNYDYHNVDSQMKKASSYFTREGWQAYQNKWQQSGNPQDIQTKKIKVNTTLGQDMTFKMTRVPPFIWTVEVPLTVNKQSSNSTTKQQVKAIVKVSQDQQHQYKIQQLDLKSQ